MRAIDVITWTTALLATTLVGLWRTAHELDDAQAAAWAPLLDVD